VLNRQTGKRVERRQLGPFPVLPVGFGAMQLAGPGVFGPPRDPDEAIRLLRDASGIFTYDHPAQLRQGIEDNLRTLDVDRLPVVNLRLMRTTPPDALFDDQLAAMISARDDGLIEAIGLSNVTLTHLLHVLRATEVACVQNAYHLANRRSQPVLDECTRRGIAFVPFAPLASGILADNSETALSKVGLVAKRFGCTPAQVAIAWTLSQSPHTLVIAGTSSIAHLRENLAAMTVSLDGAALEQLAETRPDRI
jgi:pyridoxine 4-dehydrogenase